jgi:hypothetical protein
LEGGSWKGCDNIRNKELVVYSYQQRRIEATFKGCQDSYRAVQPMTIWRLRGMREGLEKGRCPLQSKDE